MKRLLATALTSAALVLTGLGVPAQAGTMPCADFDDQHAPEIVSASVTPTTGVLTHRYDTTITVTVHVVDRTYNEDCDYDDIADDPYASGVYGVDVYLDWFAGADSDGVYGSDSAEAFLASGTIYDGIWMAEFTMTPRDTAGSWRASVEAWDNGLNFAEAQLNQTVQLKRWTKPVIDVPERVRKGRKFPVTAVVAYDSSAGGYDTLTGARVTFWFKRAGTSRWVFVGTRYTRYMAEVDAAGATMFVRARHSGTWQVRYAGDFTHTHGTNSDRHRVR